MASTYERGYSFAGFQSNRPATPLPGQRVDIELDTIAAEFARVWTAIRAGIGGGGTPLPGIDLPIAGRSLKVNLLSTAALPQVISLAQLATELGVGSGGVAVTWDDVQSKPTFGNAAQRNVGAGAGQVAAGDDPRIVGALQAAQNANDIPNKALFRSNLGLKGAALLDVGVAGGVAGYDDPRFSSITSASNPAITQPALRTIPTKIFDRPDLRDYDQLDLTGQNDCAVVLQRAMQDSANQGFELNLPIMTLACGSPITVYGGNKGGPRVRGQGFGGRSSVPASRLLFAHSGVGLTVTPLGQGWTGFDDVGSCLRGFQMMRNQPALPANPGSATAANGIVADPWSPGDFDYDMVIEGPDHTLEDLMWFNATKAMRVNHSGRLFFNRLKVCGIKESFYFQDTYDSCYLNQIHDFPWMNPGHWSLFRYLLQNSYGIYFGRVDNMRIVNYFNIFKNQALYFDYYNGGTDRGNTFQPGPPAKINIVAPDLDETNQAIRFSAQCRNAEVEIVQLTTQMLREAKQGGALVRMDGFNNKLRLVAPYFDYAWASHVSVNDSGGSPSNICHVVAPRSGFWNTVGSGVNAYQQNGNGRIVIDGIVEVTGTGEPNASYTSGTTKGVLTSGGVLAKIGEGYFSGNTDGSGLITTPLPSYGTTNAGFVASVGVNVNPGYMMRQNGYSNGSVVWAVIDNANKTPVANTPVTFKWEAYA